MLSRRATSFLPWCVRSSSSGRRRTSRRMSVSRPGALMSGETGALLVVFRLTADPALADDLHALVRGNVDNPTDDISWGAPGTLLAALAMGEWTGERRWDEAARKSAAALPRAGAAMTGCGGKTTTTVASVRCMVSRETHSPCSASSSTTPSRARARPFSRDMRSARTASRTGPARRVRNSRGHETVGSVSNGAPARRVSSPAHGSTSTRTSYSPAPSSSGVRAPTRTRKATVSATARRATVSHS